MKKKPLVIAAVAIACAAVLCAAAWAFPLLQAARSLKHLADAESIDYKINITLYKEKLSEGQQQFLETVSWILQAEESACLSWEASGSVSGGQGYAQVSCKGLEGAVTDVYFSGDDIFVNVRMLYEALQENFTGAHPILGNLLPDWEYSDYVSLEQIEEIFQADIKSMCSPRLPKQPSGKSLWANLAALLRMERKKGEGGRQQFAIRQDSYQVTFEIEKPSGLAAWGTDVAGGQAIKSWEAKACGGAAKEIGLPESVMGQEEIDRFRELWKMAEGALGAFGKER